MTKMSFRVADTEAAEAAHWAEELGVDTPQLLRDALHRHLVHLEIEMHANGAGTHPATNAAGRQLDEPAWGPAEDWAEWDDATG
jgi:hypothetical protein